VKAVHCLIRYTANSWKNVACYWKKGLVIMLLIYAVGVSLSVLISKVNLVVLCQFDLKVLIVCIYISLVGTCSTFKACKLQFPFIVIVCKRPACKDFSIPPLVCRAESHMVLEKVTPFWDETELTFWDEQL